MAPELAKAATGGTTSGIVKGLLPGDAWDAAKTDRLWLRYELDYRRRQIG